MLLLLLIFCTINAKKYDEVILAGYDKQNTRDFPSLINKNNVETLGLVSNLSLCGAMTATPLIKDGRIYASDFGGCYSCFNEDDNSLIFRRYMSTDYGFPSGMYARGMPTYDAATNLVIMGSTNIGSFLYPSGGAWLFAVNLTNGGLVWKSLVTNYSWAIITQSPLLHDGRAFFGTASGEPAAPYTAPNTMCCSFVGTAYAYNISNGIKIWETPMIPTKYLGLNYSGLGIWGSTFALGNDGDAYFGTGEFYSTPTNVSDCNIANPLNQSCVPSDIHLDSVVRIDLETGTILNSFRTSAADTWNIACYFNSIGVPLPGCVSVDIAFDFDVTTVQYSKKSELAFASSKSGYKFGFTKNLTFLWASKVVTGGTVGGYSWQGSISDSNNPKHIEIYGANTNGNRNVVTLTNSSNVTSGVFTKHDGEGNLKWVVAADNDQVYGAVTLTNNVLFGQNRIVGKLVAIDTDSGEILWTFETKSAMNGAPAIVGSRVYWGTGAGNNPSNFVSQSRLLVFELQ